MLIAFPVLPLLASTMVSPGRSSPSRSARSIMYLAMRALIDPEGLRYSSLTHIPSTMTRGVSPIASKIVPPPRRTTPAAGSRGPAAGSRASSAAERAPLMASMPAPHVRWPGPDQPSLRARQWRAGHYSIDPFPEDASRYRVAGRFAAQQQRPPAADWQITTFSGGTSSA